MSKDNPVKERAKYMFVFGEGTVKVGRGPVSNPDGISPYGVSRPIRREIMREIRRRRTRIAMARAAHWKGRR